jgi:DNA polymerase-1
LTYQGMWKTLVNNLGWTEEKAKGVETNYHELYTVSDEWIQDKLIAASKTGYITTAFGLRVRTPILKQTLLGKKSTPFEAEAESRTAGNALGQAWGLLNNRAGIEFQSRVLASPYAMDIKPVLQIHDALYFIIKDTLGCVKWFNDNLPDCMAWQKLPEIQHDVVKLSGSVDIFHPNWTNSYTLPNNASRQEIVNICQGL